VVVAYFLSAITVFARRDWAIPRRMFR